MLIRFILLIIGLTFSFSAFAYTPKISAETVVKFANQFQDLKGLMKFLEPELGTEEYKQTKNFLEKHKLFDMHIPKKWEQKDNKVIYDKRLVLEFNKNGSFQINGQVFSPFRKGKLDLEVGQIIKRLGLENKKSAFNFALIDTAHAFFGGFGAAMLMGGIVGGFLGGYSGILKGAMAGLALKGLSTLFKNKTPGTRAAVFLGANYRGYRDISCGAGRRRSSFRVTLGNGSFSYIKRSHAPSFFGASCDRFRLGELKSQMGRMDRRRNRRIYRRNRRRPILPSGSGF